MSREIKFRGLREDGKGWGYGDLVTDGKNSNNKDLAWIFPESANEYTFDLLVRVSLKTVGQFTGVTNEHQQEIYDGDKILYNGIDEKRHGKGGKVHGVYWHKTHYGWLAYSIEHEQYLEAEFFCVCKVVGNIHEPQVN